MTLQSREIIIDQPGPLRLARVLLVLLICVLLLILVDLLAYSNFVIVYLSTLLLVFVWIRPISCLYFLVILFPLFGDNPGGRYRLYFLDMVVIILLIEWLVRLVRQRPLRFRRTPFDLWIGLFVFLTCLSFAPLWNVIGQEYLASGGLFPFLYKTYTTYATTMRWSLRAFLDLGISVLLFYYIVNRVETLSQVKWLLVCLIGSAIVASLLGILDYHGLISLTFYRPLNEDILALGFVRLQSLFGHSGWFAEYLVMVAPFLIAALIFSRRKRTVWGFLALYIIVHALVFTYARGGWVTFLASGGFIIALAGARSLALRQARLRTYVIALVIALAMVAIGSYTLVQLKRHDHPLASRLLQVARFKDRTDIWAASLRLYTLQPLFGIGTGNYYARHAITFLPPHPYDRLDKVTAHSTYLHMLVERGPITFLAFIGLLVVALRWGMKAFNRCGPDDARKKFLFGCTGALLAFAIYSLMQYMFYVRIIELMFWIILGLLFFLIRDDFRCAPLALSRRKTLMLLAGLAVLLLVRIPGCSTRDLHWRTDYLDDIWILGNRNLIVSRQISAPILRVTAQANHPDIQQRPVKLRLCIDGQPVDTQIISTSDVQEIEYFVPDFVEKTSCLQFTTDRTWTMMDHYSLEFLYPFGISIAEEITCADRVTTPTGFYSWETARGQQDASVPYRTFRWTHQRAALTAPMQGRYLTVPLMVGHPDVERRPVKVDIYFNRTLLDTAVFHQQDSWKNIRVEIPAPVGTMGTLGFVVDRNWCPEDYGLDDQRVLGVLMGKFQWHP